jgi:hypothetical protein
VRTASCALALRWRLLSACFAALPTMFTGSCMFSPRYIISVFSLLCSVVPTIDRLKKKFSTDFMAKDSAVWIDPQKRSLHWYETHCDVCSLCTAGVSSMR